jgi:GNAT superfamily N-acetyltransferase
MSEAHLPIEIQPATSERWDDLAELFGPQGACGGCWCMYWRQPHAQHHQQSPDERRAALESLTGAPVPPGILAYAGGRAVGWCAVGPRSDFAALARSRNLQPVDGQPVWSIVCFFVAKPARRRGVSLALIRGAVEFARAHGGQIVEAYPIDLESPRYAGRRLSGAGGYEGNAATFRAAGFGEVRRASATQLIMRYALG